MCHAGSWREYLLILVLWPVSSPPLLIAHGDLAPGRRQQHECEQAVVGKPFAGAELMPPVGMLAPLPDVLLVMGAEVVTIRSATIIAGAVLRHSCACENRQSGSQHDSM